MYILLTFAILTAIAATVLSMIFIVPEKRRENLPSFGKFVHEILNFNHLFLEKILHTFYILSMCFTLSFGFFMLFYFEEVYHYAGSYYSGYYTQEWRGYIGFLILLLGPIAIRIFYEVIMMFILTVKNILAINSKLKDQNESEKPAAPQPEANVGTQPVGEHYYAPMNNSNSNNNTL